MRYCPLMEPQVASLSDLRRFTLADGVSAQARFGEQAMLNLVEFAPGAIMPGVFAPIREHDRALVARAMRSATDARGRLHRQAERHDTSAG